jgi:hypothetical protein
LTDQVGDGLILLQPFHQGVSACLGQARALHGSEHLLRGVRRARGDLNRQKGLLDRGQGRLSNQLKILGNGPLGGKLLLQGLVAMT